MYKNIAIFVVLALGIALLTSGLAYANGVKQPVKPAEPVISMPPPVTITPSQPAVTTGMGPAVVTMVCPSSVAVDDCYVYILNGDRLTKLNKTTMQVINCVILPASASTMTE